MFCSILLYLSYSFCVVLNIKTVFKGIAGGIVIASAFELLRRSSTYDQLVSAVNTCVLPAGVKLIQIAEGSVNLKVQAENRLALDNLWRMYKNGTLKARLEALFVTDETRELTGGEGVEVIVTIDEQEYEKARDELTTEARGNNPSARLLTVAFRLSQFQVCSSFPGHLSGIFHFLLVSLGTASIFIQKSRFCA